MENVIQQIDPANPINWRSNLNSSLLVRLIAGKNQSALQAKGFGQRPQIWVQNGSPAIGSNFGRPGGIASFNFNGTDAWFQPSVLSSYLTGSAPGKFSMLMWVRCTENVNANYSFYGSFGNFFGIHSNLLAMQNGAQAFRVSSYTVPTNKWEHYAACYDGAVLNFYVNGVFNSSVSYTGGNLPGNDGNPFNSPSIGASNGNVLYKGQLDDIALFGRCLGEGEVAAWRNDSLQGGIETLNFLPSTVYFSVKVQHGHGPPASKKGFARSPILASRQIVGVN